jgi:hypothetical protein
MHVKRKIIIGILAALAIAAFHLGVVLREPMIRYAVRDSIVLAATWISPRAVLWSMCITAVSASLLVSFSTFIFDQIPYFRKRRIAEQSRILRDERDRWQRKYAVMAERCEEAEKWRAEMEPLLKAEKSMNRNFNGRVSEAERNLGTG